MPPLLTPVPPPAAPAPGAPRFEFLALSRTRRLALIMACPMSILLALLVIGWAQEAGMKSLDLSRTMLVLALIGLPGVTGVAVLFDRAAARRAARAAELAEAEGLIAPTSTHARESRAGTLVVRHGPHESRSRQSGETVGSHEVRRPDSVLGTRQ